LIIGLPGTGLGGIFYIVSALLMPFVELTMTLRGRSSRERWRSVGLRVSLALGVLAGITLTYVALDRAIRAMARITADLSGTTERAVEIAAQQLPRYSALLITLATIVAVLMSVEILRIALRPRRHRPA
jgi:hypothetical protein